MRLRAVLALLILPALFAVGSIQLVRARGPLWLGWNSDPSYQYLFSSLLMLNGLPPWHVDHPGTPVQSLGAAVLQAATPGHTPREQTIAVLQEPESALAAIQWTLVALAAAAFAVTGLLVAMSTRALWLGLAVQTVPLWNLSVWRGMTFVAPEALLPSLTIVYVALIYVRDRVAPLSSPDRRTLWLSVAIGLIGGAATATKITFAPLWLLPVLTAATWPAVLVTVASLLGATALFLAPIASQWPRMFRWLTQVATHAGTYGEGPQGFTTVAVYRANLAELITGAPVLVGAIAASFVVAAIVWRRTEAATVRRPLRLLVGAAVCQVVGFLLIAKHGSAHYLVPLETSLGFNAMVVADLARSYERRAFSRGLLVVAGMGTIASVVAFGGLRRDLSERAAIQRATYERIAALTRDGVRVDYYRSSSPEFALYFGNAGAWRAFGPLLDELHPQRIFYNIFAAHQFERFEGRVPLTAVFRDRPVYLAGTETLDHRSDAGQVPMPPGWQMRPRERFGDTMIYAVTPPFGAARLVSSHESPQRGQRDAGPSTQPEPKVKEPVAEP